MNFNLVRINIRIIINFAKLYPYIVITDFLRVYIANWELLVYVYNRKIGLPKN